MKVLVKMVLMLQANVYSAEVDHTGALVLQLHMLPLCIRQLLLLINNDLYAHSELSFHDAVQKVCLACPESPMF